MKKMWSDGEMLIWFIIFFAIGIVFGWIITSTLPQEQIIDLDDQAEKFCQEQFYESEKIFITLENYKDTIDKCEGLIYPIDDGTYSNNYCFVYEFYEIGRIVDGDIECYGDLSDNVPGETVCNNGDVYPYEPRVKDTFTKQNGEWVLQ